MEAIFAEKLPTPTKQWLARAIVGMVVADGVIDETELKFLKEAIGFLKDESESASLLDCARNKKIPGLTPIKLEQSIAFSVLTYLSHIATSDNSLSTSEVEFIKTIGNLVGFNAPFVHEVTKWCLNITAFGQLSQTLFLKVEQNPLKLQQAQIFTRVQQELEFLNHLSASRNLPIEMSNWLVHVIADMMIDQDGVSRIEMRYIKTALKLLENGEGTQEFIEKVHQKAPAIKILKEFRKVALRFLLNLFNIMVADGQPPSAELISSYALNLGLDAQFSQEIVKWVQASIKITQREKELTKIALQPETMQMRVKLGT